MTCNEIWVVAETRNGSPTRVTSQILGVAANLAKEKGLDAVAVLLGGEQGSADELAGLANRVLWLQSSALDSYEATRYVAALSQLVETRGAPVAILTGASSSGMEFSPRLAARCVAGYLSSCVDFWWKDESLATRRPVFGGKVYEELAFTARPAVATVRSGAFAMPEKRSEPGSIEAISMDISDSLGAEITGRAINSSGSVDLTEAARVVAGGRGMGSAENFKLVEDLAEALDAAVGASRAIVDSGWRSHDEQVGKSGKTISPELYIACGISGAIHHTLGMNTSKVVAAINTDPDALIFQSADFGLVGDALEVLPALTAALKEE